MTEAPTFKIYFNKNKQWIDIYLWETHPTTFANWGGGRWGYFEPKWENPTHGMFGEIHFVKSRVREDVVVHELFHAVCEVIWARRDAITGRNEEKYAELLDELTRKFYREFKKRN